MAVKELSKKFNVSIPTIYKIFKEYGMRTYSKQDLYNIGTIQNYFETIDTEKKAYFLGLLIADGCVYEFKPNHFWVILSLQKCDTYMVRLFAKEVKANRKIVTDKRDESMSITITSDKMKADLEKYGVVPHKTFCTYLPMIEENLMPHLIRGILDGDGNIGLRKRNREGDFCKGNIRFQISFCGSQQLMTDLRDYLVEKLSIKQVKVCREQSIYSIRWSSKQDVLLIGEYLYKDSNICLVRKKKSFSDCLSYF